MTKGQDIRGIIEDKIRVFPIVNYAFIGTGDIPFTERVRYICENECEKYAKTWACPPAVGTVDECKKRCMAYKEAFFFGTICDVMDPMDMTEMGPKKIEHERLTWQINKVFTDIGLKTQPLSTGSCLLCDECTYPGGPCKKPDEMYPGMESYGILVAGLAEKCGMGFLCSDDVVSLFSLILYN